MIGFQKVVFHRVGDLNPSALPFFQPSRQYDVLGTPEESQLYRQEDFPAVALNPSPTIEEHREEIKS